MSNTINLFAVAKCFKEYLVGKDDLSSEQIWLFQYPDVTTLGTCIHITTQPQDENYIKNSLVVDIAVKDKKENIKSLLTKFELVESYLVGNMYDISDGGINEYRVLRMNPISQRIFEQSEDKINTYHYRLYAAIVVNIIT